MGEEDIGQSLKTEFDEEPGASSSDAGSIGSASNSTDSLAAATRTFPTGVRSALDADLLSIITRWQCVFSDFCCQVELS